MIGASRIGGLVLISASRAVISGKSGMTVSGAAPYSAVIPLSRITLPHFARSLLIRA